jgi:hypothetical protein
MEVVPLPTSNTTPPLPVLMTLAVIPTNGELRVRRLSDDQLRGDSITIEPLAASVTSLPA